MNDERDPATEPADDVAADPAVSPQAEAADVADGTATTPAQDGAEDGSEPETPDGAGTPEDAGTPDGAETTSDNPLDTEAEIAADYLEELLDIADLDGDIDTYLEGDRAHVSIVSESDVLVGAKGEVLDALQELTRLAVMTETGDRSRLMLDVAGYRDRRRDELTALATDAIAAVRSNQERMPLQPMNPFERKIVHDAVAAAGLSSASEGEEPRRHVVVLPA